MSTRSAIGIVRKNNTVKGIYCHWDGYPEGVGDTLFRHYQDTKKINQLLKLGDLSILGEIPESKPEMWADYNARGNNCLAYRDRGEKVPAEIFENYDKFVENYKQCGAEFIYTYDTFTKKWYVYDLWNDKIADLGKVLDREV